MTKKKVYLINGKLFVADNVDRAIMLFKKEYPFPDEVEEVTLVKDSHGFSLATVEEPCDSLGDFFVDPAMPRDNCVDPNYLNSITLDDEMSPIPVDFEPCVCKELPPDFIIRDEEPQGNFTAKKEAKDEAYDGEMPL